MKLLLDEMISNQVAERLRKKGHDVIAVTAEATPKGSSDPDVFEAAQAQKRAVVTYNRGDFEAIVGQYDAASRAHHGLVIVNPTRHPNDQFRRLVNALDKLIQAGPPYRSFTTWLKD